MFNFTYELVGPGWVRASLTDEYGNTTITASYLSDALKDLIVATSTIAEGGLEARCAWSEEPGEYRWIFHRHGDEVLLEILAFDTLPSPRPDAEGRPVHTSRQKVLRVAQVVSSEAKRLLDELGETEYREQWIEHSFPSEALCRLQEAIGSCRQSHLD